MNTKNLCLSLFLITSVLLSIGFVSAGQAVQSSTGEIQDPAENQYIGGTFLIHANQTVNASRFGAGGFAGYNVTNATFYLNGSGTATAVELATVSCNVGGLPACSNQIEWNYSFNTAAYNGNYTLVVEFWNYTAGDNGNRTNSSGLIVQIDNTGPNITISYPINNQCFAWGTATGNLIEINGTLTPANKTWDINSYFNVSLDDSNVTLLGSGYWGLVEGMSHTNVTKPVLTTWSFVNTTAYVDGQYNLTIYGNSSANNTQIFGANNTVRFWVDTTAPTPQTYAIWAAKTEDTSVYCKPKSVGATECTEAKYSYPFTLTPGKDVTLTCEMTDATSGVMRYKFYVKLPGQSNFHLVKEGGSSTYNFLETTKTGDYYAYCSAQDRCNNTGYIHTNYEEKAIKFRVRSEEDFGTGGEAGASAKTFAVDFSKETEKTLSKGEGRIITLSFDGLTEHTITIDKVTADSVTLTIKSDPITVTINKGETVNVDINEDGIDDLSITLDDIVQGNAKITYKKLEGAQIVAEEESPSDITTTTAKVEVEKPTPKTGLWVTIAIIAIGLIAYFIYAKKKK